MEIELHAIKSVIQGHLSS